MELETERIQKTEENTLPKINCMIQTILVSLADNGAIYQNPRIINLKKDKI